MTLLERAALVIRESVDAPAPPSRAAARKRLVEAVVAGRRRRLPTGMALALAAAVAVLALVLGVVPSLAPAPAPITFTVGATQPGIVGAYVTPSGSPSTVLEFSEGSRVELTQEARARVTQTSARGASLLLESGSARVSVVHRPGADWVFIAGSYTIRVEGTAFDVTFDPSTETLTLDMRSGVVAVTGPGIDAPLRIRGEQRFTHSARRRPREAVTGRTPASAAVSTSPPPALPSAASSVGAPPPRLSWATLAARGAHDKVVADADARGLDAVLASVPADELMVLAHAARYQGRTDLAARAYRMTRERFPGTTSAADAAFLLGRMTEGASPAGAIAWYELYAAEAPGGGFVAEALGRRMVALQRSGASDAALQAAHEYLARFPNGPYAGVAREMTAP